MTWIPKGNSFQQPSGQFVVTESLSGRAEDEHVGGLLGMLLRAMMQQGQVQPVANSRSTSNGLPEYNSDSYGSPQGGLLGRFLALQDERARNAVDGYGSYDRRESCSPDQSGSAAGNC